MVRRRSILLHGLRLLAARPGTLLWTYAANLALALAFSLKVRAQLGSVLDHSLAAERLNSAFDLGTLNAAFHRISYMAPSTGSSAFAGVPLYLLCYFILVPGTLFCYQAECPARLSTLVSSGLSFFWRFVRITLLTAIVSGAVLVPLMLLLGGLTQAIDDRTVGWTAIYEELPGIVLIALAAALLRLYFDLVEVYTVQLGDRFLPDGRPDRRVRTTLLPALRTLRANFVRAYGSFVALALLGFAAVFVTGRIALHMLAQPRVWPMFLLAQAGLLAMMATRFWQRGAETILAADNPLPRPAAPAPYAQQPIHYSAPLDLGPRQAIADAQSDPEPAAPSLDEPDAGVFHREAGPRD
jgi:hypothetical protein